MIPLRDSHPTQLRPTVTYTLIGVNALIFFMELFMGSNLKFFIMIFGFVPSRFLLQIGEGAWVASIIPLFTSMFLHGGWLHLIGNMWTLYIFGDNVEDTLGHFPIPASSPSFPFFFSLSSRCRLMSFWGSGFSCSFSPGPFPFWGPRLELAWLSGLTSAAL